MNSTGLFDTGRRLAAALVLGICLVILVSAVQLASLVQTDFGRVAVTNVSYPNESGIPVRAKLLRPVSATAGHPAPGVIFVPGYQGNRETGDGIAIELARRGFVVLAIDAIGRGNSGIPDRDPGVPGFDVTFGSRASFAWLKSRAFVRGTAVGMIGYSMGAEMSYKVALEDEDVKALVLIGFAYTTEATPTNPKNMLMIIGRYNEFRDRMTGTRNIVTEWMRTPQTKAAISNHDPRLGVTYGDFDMGDARRVFVPDVIHIMETHNSEVITEVLDWMNNALAPAVSEWIDPGNQIWPIKEWCTLVAMVAGFATLLPLCLLLLGTKAFRSLQTRGVGSYACSKRDYFRHAGINGLIMWLYLPSALIIFGIHKYVVPIDGVFPMMIVSALIWWFVVINIIGFFLFRRWLKRSGEKTGTTAADLGISFGDDRIMLDWRQLGKTAILAFVLFAFVYCAEHILEAIFIVDFRFLFAFASDLTPYRVLMFGLYYPFLLIGFLQLGFFLHGQLRLPRKATWLKTYLSWTGGGLFALIAPLILFLAVQYVPLFTTQAIPLVGPGGMFVMFIINIFHIIGVLALIIPVSTWCYQLTGRPYLGALLCAALVAWMFTSSQVIAPVPID
ncbi:MAG: alpha/beta fold hydrolase [Deltaproteobacteria bacterium]|nr:alpha/beta fold hydrolase [Deltaproteobacteria bacterium]